MSKPTLIFFKQCQPQATLGYINLIKPRCNRNHFTIVHSPKKIHLFPYHRGIFLIYIFYIVNLLLHVDVVGPRVLPFDLRHRPSYFPKLDCSQLNVKQSQNFHLPPILGRDLWVIFYIFQIYVFHVDNGLKQTQMVLPQL